MLSGSSSSSVESELSCELLDVVVESRITLLDNSGWSCAQPDGMTGGGLVQ